MKYATLIFFLAFIESISQTVGSDCIGKPEDRLLYKKSAAKLALVQTENVLNTYKDSVKINPVFSQRFLNALVAVYNATNLAASDTVCRYITMQAVDPETNSILVFVDSNFVWLKNFRNGVYPTGNNSFDSLYNRYHFSLSNYSTENYQYSSHILTLRSDSNYNLTKLTLDFNAINLACIANNTKKPYEWNYIYYDSLETNALNLHYEYVWNYGNFIIVPKRRTWKFKIDNSCSVTYLGSFGDILPKGLINLPENTLVANSIQLYPNPTSDKLYIEGIEKQTFQNAELVDASGQVALQIDENELLNNKLIQTSTLSSGFYLLRVRQNNKLSVFKILVVE